MLDWIDIHAHLNMLEVTPEEAIENAKKKSVSRIITIGTCPEDHPVVLGLARKYPNVYCTLGVHPHDAKDFDSACEKYICDNLADPKVVAVGEIGLDYYYEHSPVDIQQKAFRRQLEIAVEQDLPVQIHTRDAEDDTLNILKEFKGRVKGVIHCFTGTQRLADEVLQLGLNISVSGVMTFKKADELRQVLTSVPIERMHVETDAPFLTPVPFRGKKNQPAYVVHTAEKLAELKSVSMDQLAKVSTQNTLKLFSRMV